MIYFTADTHFCHNNIIHSCERPFTNADEMDKAMIERWNSCVTARDEIYILGDLLYRGNAKQANDILSKLKGRKYLVKGNHEKYLDDPLFKVDVFEWVKDFHILKYEKTDFVLFHYPMLTWHKSHYGSIHLYGHVHNSGIKNHDFGEKIKMLGPRAINVGVDMNDFYPVSIKTIMERTTEK